jgi:hypothetical protein
VRSSALSEYVQLKSSIISKGLFVDSTPELVGPLRHSYAQTVQRLYTMFPAGFPGAALLVLRGCIAASFAGIAFPSGWQHGAFVGLLTLLCIGLFTPIVCGVAVSAVFLDLPQLQSGNMTQLIIVVAAGVAYAFLGPGAYSIDAKLFGRRKLLSSDVPWPERDDPKW